MRGFFNSVLSACVLLVALAIISGCGSSSGSSGTRQLNVTVSGLGQLQPGFNYSAWIQTPTFTNFLTSFTPNADGTANFIQFASQGNVTNGDRVFITIEQASSPLVPSQTIILDGTIQGNTEILRFPGQQNFTFAQGTILAPQGNQIITQFTGLPDISVNNFIYQGFLQVGNTFTPLNSFDSTQTTITDNVPFNVGSALYRLTIRPRVGSDPNVPFNNFKPFFTITVVPVGTALPVKLNRSDLTPGSPNFFFPTGTVTLPQ